MADNKADTQSSTAFLRRLLEADRASELAEMINGIAHELNQPLAAMATFSQAGVRMLDRPDPMTARSLDVFRSISQEALQAGSRLQAVRRLFDPGPPQLAHCAMSDLVSEVRPVLRDLAAAVDAQLQTELPPELPNIHVDRLKIQRVLIALVKNAAEASANISAARIIRIDVVRERYSIETGVTDHGAGVAADVRQQLFRPFFTTKASGHGLGLASSQVAVGSHGGSMGFTNIPDGGVRFWFKLPVSD
jgi:C4-dicarboxylate-specific signal transduction histidine kinase